MLADLVVLLAVGLYTNLDEKGTEAMRATVQLLLVVGLYTNLDEKGTEAIRATVQLPFPLSSNEARFCNTSYAGSEDGGVNCAPGRKPGARTVGSENVQGWLRAGILRPHSIDNSLALC